MTALTIAAVVKIGLLIGGLMTAAAYFVLLERRLCAWIQDRLGPNRVGAPLSVLVPGLRDLRLSGLGQPAADGVKFILKEEYTPAHVDRRLFWLAPISIISAALAVFATIPFGSVVPTNFGREELGKQIELVVAPGIDVGLIYVFALSSVAVYGVVLGGWASNNKYSFLGGLRSSAQLIAYELPMGLGILGVVLAAGSLKLNDIIEAQAAHGWFAFTQPLGFLVFLVAAFAEAARLPFDLPECEQELIGGYHTEYSGMKLLLFLVAEFLHMITGAFLISILFLGGWHFPGTGIEHAVDGWGSEWIGAAWLQAGLRVGVLSAKVFAVIVFFMLVRWSWPRFRYDQLMALAWKVMLPLGLVNFVAIAAIDQARMCWNVSGFVAGLLSWLVCGVSLALMTIAGPRIADNRSREEVERFQSELV